MARQRLLSRKLDNLVAPEVVMQGHLGGAFLWAQVA